MIVTGVCQSLRVGAICCVGCIPALIASLAPAIPPSPHPIEERQPDGTKIKLYLRGDKRLNWYEDVNAYTVVRGPCRYVYALRGADGDLAPTNLLVGKVNPKEAGLKPGIRPSSEAIKKRRGKSLPVDHKPAGGQRISLIPASPHAIDLRQPEGSKIQLYLRGDEKYHWYEDVNGYTVVEVLGPFVYAVLNAKGALVPTELEVGKVKPAEHGLEKRILPKQRAPDGRPMKARPR